MSYLIGFLAFIFILGAAVTLHEFGHFIVAKLFKIRVETFSFGFGPRLFGRRWGQTDYRVSAIPLGGYVKLGGDELLSPGQPVPLEVERNGQRFKLTIKPTPHTEDGETAGFLDFLPDYGNVPIVVREVVPNSPAAEAGLSVGDRIVSVNGEPVTSAEQVTQFIRDHKAQPVTLRV